MLERATQHAAFAVKMGELHTPVAVLIVTDNAQPVIGGKRKDRLIRNHAFVHYADMGLWYANRIGQVFFVQVPVR